MEKETEVKKAARLVASMRTKVTRPCIVCEREFTGIAKRIYCTPGCSQKAYRARKKDRSA